METTALRFAAAARAIGAALHRRGLVVPSFRSPPRLGGADRTLRRRADGGATIAIRLRGRPWPAVLADMVEGSVVANRLDGERADHCRAVLWSALDAASLLPPPPPAPPERPAMAAAVPAVASSAAVGARAGPVRTSRPDGPLTERTAARRTSAAHRGRARPAPVAPAARPGQSPPAAA